MLRNCSACMISSNMKIIPVFRITMLLLITACGNNKTEMPTGHTHDEETVLSYTLYGEHTELFVEFAPLIKGNETVFAAHFTNTDSNFTAVTKGKVKLTLLINGRTFKTTSLKPAAPGIFRLALLPGVSGVGKLQFDISYDNVSDQIVIDSVPVFEDEKPALAYHPETESGDIIYLKEQSWKTEFATKEVASESFGPVIRTTGRVLPAPGDEFAITAPASGTVNFANTNVLPGAEVKKGGRLFRIAGGTLNQNVGNVYNEAKINYDKAKVDFERASELVKDQLISQKEFQEVKLRFDNAAIKYNTIAPNYSEAGLTISSPGNGFLRTINVKDGDFVESGATLATVSSNKSVIVQADVSLRYSGMIPQIQSANIIIPGIDGRRETQVIHAKRAGYGKSVAAGTSFIPVTFQPDASAAIVPGTTVEVNILLKPDTNVIAIPLSALIEEQGNFYVFVQVRGESFRKQEITTGRNDGVNVEIKSGLQHGDRVVTKGAYAIKLASATGTLPDHGHAH